MSHFADPVTTLSAENTTDTEPSQRALEAAAHQRLSNSGYAQLRSVACHCIAGKARLSGHISSYYLKQIAQETVRRIDGIKHVDNLLEVHASL